MKNKAVALLLMFAMAAFQPALVGRAALLPPNAYTVKFPITEDEMQSMGEAQGFPSRSQNISLDGHLGGPCRTVSVQGRFAYIGTGTELAVLDISSPPDPQRVGYLVFPARVVDVQAVGDSIFVIVDDWINGAALWAVDISAPYSPRALGSLPLAGHPEEVAVSGRYAFVAGGTTGMRIIDILTPLAMREIGFYQIPDLAVDIKVSGQYAYVAASNQGMRIIDIQNLAAPKEIGYYKSPWNASGVDVSGSYAYVADVHMGLRVVDIHNPAHPVEVGSMNITELARDVVVSGHYAYLTDLNDGLALIDISDPTHPSWNIYQYLQGSSMDEIALGGEYAYVASEGFGLRVVHVANPQAPVQVGSYSPSISPTDIAAQDGFVYTADFYKGLEVIDVLDSVQPVSVGREGEYGEWGSLALEGQFAYLIDGFRLRVIDVSNPFHPATAGELIFGNGYGWDEDRGVDIAVSGSYAYLASLDGGLLVIDLSEPAEPRQVSKIAGMVNTVAVDGAYLYTAGDDFQIWDIQQPDRPKLIGSYPLDKSFFPWGVVDISPAGRYIYLLSDDLIGDQGSGRLTTLDLSQPSTPVSVSSVHLRSGFFTKIKTEGRYVIITSVTGDQSGGLVDEGNLYVFDVSQPTTPFEIGSYPIDANSLDVVDGKIFVATYEGLFILHLGYTVSGMVQHANGQPYAGAVVSAGAGAAEAITGADGRYALNGLLSGTYTLSARSNAAPTKSTLQEVTLPPDVTLADLTLLPATTSVDLAPGTASSLVFTDTQGLPTRLDFPTGSVTAPTTINLEPLLVGSSTWLASTGHAFNLEASQGGQAVPKFSFTAPVRITIRYSDEDLRGSREENGLRFLRWHNDAWQDHQESCALPEDYTQDPESNTFSPVICQAGTYALFVPAYQAFFPIVP